MDGTRECPRKLYLDNAVEIVNCQPVDPVALYISSLPACIVESKSFVSLHTKVVQSTL